MGRRDAWLANRQVGAGPPSLLGGLPAQAGAAGAPTLDATDVGIGLAAAGRDGPEAPHRWACRAQLSAFGPYDTSETGERLA